MDKLFEKFGNFIANCSETDIVMLATLILIPVLAVVLLIVTIVRHVRGRHEEEEEAEVLPVENEVVEPAEAEAAPVQPVVYARPVQQVAVPERVKVKVRVTDLKKADKYLLMATGIFCVGLGAMIQRAMSGDK